MGYVVLGQPKYLPRAKVLVSKMESELEQFRAAPSDILLKNQSKEQSKGGGCGL